MSKMKTAKLNATQAARALGVTYGTLANWRAYGVGPKWTKVGRAVVYDRADIKAWKATVSCPQCGQSLPLRSRSV